MSICRQAIQMDILCNPTRKKGTGSAISWLTLQFANTMQLPYHTAFLFLPDPISSLIFVFCFAALSAFAAHSSLVSFFSTSKIATSSFPWPWATWPRHCQRVQRLHIAFHWTTIFISGRSIPYYNLSVSPQLILFVAHHSKCICIT